MANVQTTINTIQADFLPESTEVYVRITSSDPVSPVWGNGIKHKSFEAGKSLQDILQEDIANYIEWEYVCPSCRKKRGEEYGFCNSPFHLDPLENVLSMFNVKSEEEETN